MKKSILFLSVVLATTFLVACGKDTAVVSYTLDDVAQHADMTSCWSVVSGDVYDLSSFFGKHKGGDEKLLLTCGKDATALFTKKHGGQEKPEMKLTTFVIGTLK